MSAQDLEQRARELLAQIRQLLESLPVDCLGSGIDASGQPYPIRDEVIHGITKLLAQQPAPADVSEVTRQLIERDRRGRAKYGTSLDRTDLTLPDWLQHMAEELLDAAGYALAAKRTAQHQPAPVVDDARMARALEWVRDSAWSGNDQAQEHLPAIEEAIAAYDPNCGARTVRVVDDAMGSLARATLARAQGVQS